MMGKQEHIDYWKQISEMDWHRAELMLKQKDYVFALFCLHMSMEKLIKALWVKENKDNFPPRLHNLITLISDTSYNPSGPEAHIIEELNRYQLEGRYPDYKRMIYKYTQAKFAKNIFSKIKTIKACLLKKIS